MPDGLVLLHAFPLDSSMWAPQVEALSGDVPVVTPEFPGFGGTAVAAPEGYMDAAADAALAAMDAAGMQRAVVCGLSMGGYAAFALWRRHPDRVAGLVLANTRSGADDDAGKQRRADLAQRLRSEGNGFLADTPPPLLSTSAPLELTDQVKSIIRKQPAEAIAAASLGMGSRPDSTGDLAGITVPVLVITAAGDTLIPPDATSPMASQVPNGRLEVLGDAGHLSNLEAPDVFSNLLREHLEACGVLSA